MDLGHNTRKIKTYGKKRTDRVVTITAWNNTLDPERSESLSRPQIHDDKENDPEVWDEKATLGILRPKQHSQTKDIPSSPSRHTKRAVKPARIPKVISSKPHLDPLSTRAPLAPKHISNFHHPSSPSPVAPKKNASPIVIRDITPSHSDDFSDSPFAAAGYSTPKPAKLSGKAATSTPKERATNTRTPAENNAAANQKRESKAVRRESGRRDVGRGREPLGMDDLDPFSTPPLSPIGPGSSCVSPITLLSSISPLPSLPTSSLATSTPRSHQILRGTELFSTPRRRSHLLSFHADATPKPEPEPETECDPHLRRLFALCEQKDSVSFEELLGETSLLLATKIGEATFAEVFLIPFPVPSSASSSPTRQAHSARPSRTVVAKIIPFAGIPLVNGQVQSSVADATQEARVTEGMGSVFGFVGVVSSFDFYAELLIDGVNRISHPSPIQSTAVCRGSYPSSFLNAWDSWDTENGSENDRPDYFSPEQLYLVLLLEYGGRDLERVKVAGWRQAAGVFWQVAAAVAGAEEVRAGLDGRGDIELELCRSYLTITITIHRDLHWGNILLRPTKEQEPGFDASGCVTVPLTDEKGKRRTVEVATHGMRACVIDYTLARMDGADGDVIYRDLMDLYDGTAPPQAVPRADPQTTLEGPKTLALPGSRGGGARMLRNTREVPRGGCAWEGGSRREEGEEQRYEEDTAGGGEGGERRWVREREGGGAMGDWEGRG
ncbi:hypothetical protein BC938DRAFT_473361 [Jimgerdemannia flammicorona]|uniref:Protein kinase domain-containing protein n=1 Tax=Jimgerdemannia flammicorona TaxID=994334 RepID=A0A433Q475_9FUNG|nr:hypothetical protein BC938DRAFT_473361 [Jimgerdemannia flammicorona]